MLIPNDITTGPDGALWAPDGSLGVVWRLTTSGKISSFETGVQPAGIASAHGALWVTDASGNKIVRLGVDGTTTDYPLPTPGAFPIGIVEGPDGALWFTEGRGDKIGRLALDGTITEYPLPTCGAFAGDIAVGADGAIWFTERNTNAIARITIVGELTNEFPLPTEFADPKGVVVGPDDALWIAQRDAGTIARMTFDGAVTREFRVPSGAMDSLANGPDGALWFPQGTERKIGRLDIGFDPPVTATGTTFTARAFMPATRSVATFRDADPDARPADYDVRIAWGDGTRSTGTVHRTADGGFEVRGRHTFFKARTHRVVVRITDGVGKGLDAKVESTAIVHR